MNKKTAERKSGVLMHISSLPGKYSCGAFGRAAFDFIDFLWESGFSFWQVLPFCMPDRYSSPYASYGAFSGNPNFIDLDLLAEEGLLTEEELESAAQTTPYAAEFARLAAQRLPLLRMAYRRFTDRAAIDAFFAELPELRNFCSYMAIKDRLGDTPWQEWQDAVPDEDDLYFHGFLQLMFDRQWRAVKAYANQRGIKIIGDIPIYVALDSADVYFHRELFALDESGYPTEVAGVPPDFFSADGQLWGNPLYRWDKMKEDGYAWWCNRISYMLRLFDGVRIDHFRGLESYFAVRATETTARNGVWKKGPGKPFIRAIRAVAGNAFMIAEDLGVTTDAVHELVDYSGFACMRVLQFGFTTPPDLLHRPHMYPVNAAAYTGTHDNTPLLAYLLEAGEETRREIFRYCGYEGSDFPVGFRSVVRTLFRSPARLVMLPIQDLLRYGCDTRMNTPGRAEGNWSYRVTEEQLASIDKAYLRELVTAYGRADEVTRA